MSTSRSGYSGLSRYRAIGSFGAEYVHAHSEDEVRRLLHEHNPDDVATNAWPLVEWLEHSKATEPFVERQARAEMPQPDDGPGDFLKAVPDNKGLRYDEAKPRWDLIPPEALLALAQHYTVGSNKYAERNWERGMSKLTCFRAVMSHAWAWMRGEVYDAETGSHHMIAAAWNCFAIFTYDVRGIGTDERPIVRKVKPFWEEPEAPKE